MSAYVKKNGIFNQISNMYVKKLSSWCSIKRGWVKKNNVWQVMFSKLLNAKWTQTGADINGEATLGGFSDRSGGSVSLNAAGNIVAIGARFNNGVNGTDSGHVRIYSWNGTIWTQLGADIDGKTADEQSGQFVSLNAAGDRVAITSASNIRVYSWDGFVWTQMGTDIVGYTKSVSLNATGDILAIGEPSEGVNNIGRVRIFSWNSSAWIQLGASINGTGTTNSGWSISLNAVGDRIAIGAPLGGPANAGVVRIYYLNGSTWTQLGSDINGYPTGSSSFGTSLCMNAAGDRLVVGAPSTTMTTKVYSWNGTAWSQLGAVIYGELSGDQSGASVSMNAAGDRIAIGAPGNDANGTDSGHVRIYFWNGTIWTQLASDIDGESASDQSGTSVSMNAAGDRIAIGAPFNNSGAGHVRIYSQPSIEQLGADIDGEASGDWSGGSVSLNEAGDRIAIGANTNDSNGGINSGHVRIYSWNGTAWVQLGSDIDGKIENERSGLSVSLNAVGDIVAIGNFNSLVGSVRVYSWNGTTWTQLGLGMPNGYVVSLNATGDRIAIGNYDASPNGFRSGQTRIYSWNGTEWTQLGSNLDGAAGDWSGSSVSMNAAGDKVAIGAPGNNNNTGLVKIYSWNGTAWTQLGSNINGKLTSSYFGVAVSLNAAGGRVAIGAIFGGNGHGSAGIYFWNGTAWTQMGSDILGAPSVNPVNYDRCGGRLSLNAAGDRVAVGSDEHDGTGTTNLTNVGHVRIFDWNGTAWSKKGADIDGEAAYDTFGSSVSLNAAGDRVATGAIYNDGNGKADSGHVRIHLLL